MARLDFVCSTPAEVALVAATAKTVLQIVAPANQVIAIKNFILTFEGIVNTDTPIEVKIERQTTAGTMSAGTPVKLNSRAETLQGDFTYNASAEPTSGDLLRIFKVHPQCGLDRSFGPGEEIEIAGGGRVGFVITAPEANNCLLTVHCEE